MADTDPRPLDCRFLMLGRVCRLSCLALLLSQLAMPSLARASGVLQKVTVGEAVRRASDVLVVEPGRPSSRIVTRRHHYVDRKTKQKKTLTISRTLFRFRVVRRLGPGDKGPQPGTMLEVVNSNALIGEQVHVSMVTTGSWPVPYLPRLEGDSDPTKGKRFLLLISGHDRKENHHIGIGGLGLLPIAREAEVLRLLQGRGKR